MKTRYGAYVAGAWRSTGVDAEIRAPWDGATVATISMCRPEDIEDAIAGAARAFDDTRKPPPGSAPRSAGRCRACSPTARTSSPPPCASRAGRLGITRRVPVGPIAAISPFNFPINLAAHKIAPAIAAGCPVILMPAPQAPISCLLGADSRITGKPLPFAKLWRRG